MHYLCFLPNALSLSRPLIAIAIVLCGSMMPQSWIFFLVLFAVLSDVFDGYLARVLHCETPAGAQLDPLCDGFFMMAMLYFVLRQEGHSLVYFWSILLRYVVISLYHCDLMSLGYKNLSSLWTGKWSSGLMMGCFVYYFAKANGISSVFIDALFPYLQCATVLMMGVSWYFYYQRYIRLSNQLLNSR